ncbi:MAG: sulfite dehydrogenase [bacterium]|nr:sulfite dehydrogenase [bacterium]
MKHSRLDFLAGGGIVDRRSFLLAGASFLAASSLGSARAEAAQGDARIGTGFPGWMRAPGKPDTGYGQPVSHESQVQKKSRPVVPETTGFTLWHTPIENQRGAITPSGLHFGVHHNGIPDIDPAKHELVIHGLVERPLTFSVENLLRYPMVSRILFIECSGNTGANALSPFARDDSCQDLFGQVSGSEWVGVPFRHLLEEAGLQASAKWAIAEGADGGSHARSVPVSKLLDDGMVAFYQNGERLRGAQGYPMRLLLPGWEGNTSVKWLHRLEFTETPAFTKDESGLYTEFLSDGSIARFSFLMDVKSVITHPSGTQTLPEKGFYEISGLAWSGHGKLSHVEVSADGGRSWAQAELHGPVLDKALTRFSIPWRWDGNPTVLLSRATDERGVRQPTRAEWKARYASHSFNHYNAIQSWRIGSDGSVENAYA